MQLISKEVVEPLPPAPTSPVPVEIAAPEVPELVPAPAAVIAPEVAEQVPALAAEVAAPEVPGQVVAPADILEDDLQSQRQTTRRRRKLFDKRTKITDNVMRNGLLNVIAHTIVSYVISWEIVKA